MFLLLLGNERAIVHIDGGGRRTMCCVFYKSAWVFKVDVIDLGLSKYRQTSLRRISRDHQNSFAVTMVRINSSKEEIEKKGIYILKKETDAYTYN